MFFRIIRKMFYLFHLCFWNTFYCTQNFKCPYSTLVMYNYLLNIVNNKVMLILYILTLLGRIGFGISKRDSLGYGWFTRNNCLKQFILIESMYTVLVYKKLRFQKLKKRLLVRHLWAKKRFSIRHCTLFSHALGKWAYS